MPRFRFHRVHAGGNSACAFADDRLSQNGGGGGAVACFVIGLGSNFAHHLCAHVFELVFQFDFLRDGNTVLGDARCAEGFVDNDVAAFRAKRHFDCISENIDAHAASFRVRHG